MVRYPIARSADGCLVHIDDWLTGDRVTCFGCDRELIGKGPSGKATRRRSPERHFAHKTDASCNGETALHAATKAAIVRAHATGLLGFWWRCSSCRSRRCVGIADLTLAIEDQPCEGVRSDVLARDQAGVPRLAIEIVVTHDLEDLTIGRYRDCGVRVLVLRPIWETLNELETAQEIHVDEVDGQHATDCDRCADLEVEAWWRNFVCVWNGIGIYKLMCSRFWESFLDFWCLLGILYDYDCTRFWKEFPRAWCKIGERAAFDSAWRFWNSWWRMWIDIGCVYARDCERYRIGWWHFVLGWRWLGEEVVSSAKRWTIFTGQWFDVGRAYRRDYDRNCRQLLLFADYSI